jgi:hypothetical protein
MKGEILFTEAWPRNDRSDMLIDTQTDGRDYVASD